MTTTQLTTLITQTLRDLAHLEDAVLYAPAELYDEAQSLANDIYWLRTKLGTLRSDLIFLDESPTRPA